MQSFSFYLMRFLIEHPEKRKDVAAFVYNSPADSYFGKIGVLATRNEINLYEANTETWYALICSPETPNS